ncbi:hypothetical protein [Streptomyces cuspidosporus]|uniref:Uncharacterized protein n=1 Tax=Streptomyces cuspidosporus TaxID=66882 RepID=A0ABP5TQQ7_9ACTN
MWGGRRAPGGPPRNRFAVNGPGKAGGDGTHRETTTDRLECAEDGTIEPVVPILESVGPVRGH